MLHPVLRSGFLFLALGLGACAADQTVRPLVAANDPVSLRIAEASEKAARALDDIAGMEQAKAPQAPGAQADFSGAPAALTVPTTLNWTGPVEQVAKTLADRASYGFRTVGKPPATPMIVTVNSYEKPLIHVMRDIGLQLGDRADLAVDARSNVVELRYGPDTRLQAEPAPDSLGTLPAAPKKAKKSRKASAMSEDK